MLIEHNFEIRSGHLLFKILEENVVIDKNRTFAEGFNFDSIEGITKQRISIYFAQLKKKEKKSNVNKDRNIIYNYSQVPNKLFCTGLWEGLKIRGCQYYLVGIISPHPRLR